MTSTSLCDERYSRLARSLGSDRTTSRSSLPGTTAEPSRSAVASVLIRTPSSRSVACNSSSPSSTLSITPASEVVGDPAMCVQNRRVVAATEVPADGRKAGVGELAGEVHGDLACERDPGPSILRQEGLGRDVERSRRCELDVAERNGLLPSRAIDVAENVLRELRRGLAAV